MNINPFFLLLFS